MTAPFPEGSKMDYNLDTTWEEAKQQLRAEFDRLWAENASLRDDNRELRAAIELAQEELRQSARGHQITLDSCPQCGYSEVQS